jgi:hypothetical protein
MAMEDISKEIHEGMEVHAADGTKLGKIIQVWYGASLGGIASTGEETCMEIHRGFLGRDKMFIPCHAVAGISGNTVNLKVDTQTAQETPSWHQKPSWIE